MTLRIAFVMATAAGGTAAHVAALAAGCREAGLTVSVLAPAPARPGASGIETVCVPIGGRPRPAHDARAVARLRRFVARWRPDIVHAHGVRAGAFAALAVALTRQAVRPALVVTVHNAPPPGHGPGAAYGVLERICARRADLVLCASGDLLARMARLRARAEQFDVPAGPAAPPTAAQVAAARAGIGAPDRPVVLAVGRLAPQKGFDVLIDAAARWRHRDPQPVTVIAGDGPLRAQLRDRAVAGRADVRLLGARDDVPALLAAAQVVVVPSRWEARALVVQEAMRAGRPVVATRVGGIAELTGEDGALLVPPEDPPALAGAVTAVLDDPALADRLGYAARRLSRAFPTQQEAVRAATERYTRLVSRSCGSGRPRTGS